MLPLLRALVLVGTSAAAFLAIAPPRQAEACSSGCSGPAHFVPDDGTTVPANLPVIVWRPRGDNPSPSASQVTLTTAADPGTPLTFTATRAPNGFDFHLVPDAPLVAGTAYVLSDSTMCSSTSTAPTARASFTAGPVAPLPTTLGTLGVTDLPARTTSIATSAGGCSTEATVISAAVAVDFATAPDATPWRDALHYQTYVDNTTWTPSASILSSRAPGASWEGRGFDRVFSVCRVEGAFPQPPSYDLPQGARQVEIRATLPGSNVAIATSTRTVTLQCPAVLPSDGDAGTDQLPGTDDGGCCSSSTNPGAAAGLALAVSAWLARRRRGQ